MTNAAKTVKPKVNSVEDMDDLVEVARYDVLLPCRTFEISYKLAVLGRVSLTGEFVLRLVRAVGTIDESNAAAFFGFDHRDMVFVLVEVEERGFIERRDGKLSLTQAGSDLFRDGGDVPEIYEVEPRREKHDFDLISLAPQRSRWLTDIDRTLFELKAEDATQVSAASRAIPDAFRRFYYTELLPSRDRSGVANKKAIYSIDHVNALGRSSAVIPVSVLARRSMPGIVEPDLTSWRSQNEVDERAKVVHAVSTFVEGLKTGRSGSEADAFKLLTDCAPEFLKEFRRTDGFAAERYFREAVERTGEARSDRQTIPIVGAVTTTPNLKKLRQIGVYARRRKRGAKHIIWLKPSVPQWGATELTAQALTALQGLFAPAGTEAVEEHPPLTTICLCSGEAEPHTRKQFEKIVASSGFLLPSQCEMLLVPGLLVILLVYSPLGQHHGFPIPLGVASFDEKVLKRAHEMLEGILSRHGTHREVVDNILGDLDSAIPELIMEPAETGLD